MRSCGRPKKGSGGGDSRQKIIDTAVVLIEKHGADALTVRTVCETAGLSIATFYHYFESKDNLLMHFVRDVSFDSLKLAVPVTDIAGRCAELYMNLIDRYRTLGISFMKSFYTTGNRALSAYMGTGGEAFPEGTVMARCEDELEEAQKLGIIDTGTDTHQVSADVCTIVKGCVFEWCLCDGDMDIREVMTRIIRNYFLSYIKAKEIT